jgi:hypothetical protein
MWVILGVFGLTDKFFGDGKQVWSLASFFAFDLLEALCGFGHEAVEPWSCGRVYLLAMFVASGVEASEGEMLRCSEDADGFEDGGVSALTFEGVLIELNASVKQVAEVFAGALFHKRDDDRGSLHVVECCAYAAAL